MREMERQLLVAELAEAINAKEEKPLCSKEAAAVLGLAERTLVDKTREGLIPHHVWEGKRYWYLSELNAMIRGNYERV